MTFCKFWYCLIKNHIDSLSLSLTITLCMTSYWLDWTPYRLAFTFTLICYVIKLLQSFVEVDMSFYGSQKLILTEVRSILISEVHKNSYRPLQKIIIVYYYIRLYFTVFLLARSNTLDIPFSNILINKKQFLCNKKSYRKSMNEITVTISYNIPKKSQKFPKFQKNSV
jgi:hypothetical protein